MIILSAWRKFLSEVRFVPMASHDGPLVSCRTFCPDRVIVNIKNITVIKDLFFIFLYRISTMDKGNFTKMKKGIFSEKTKRK